MSQGRPFDRWSIGRLLKWTTSQLEHPKGQLVDGSQSVCRGAARRVGRAALELESEVPDAEQGMWDRLGPVRREILTEAVGGDMASVP